MPEINEYSDEYLEELDRSELINILKKVIEENKKYKKIIHESHKKNENCQKVEFVSFGSSNIMFLNGEADSEIQKYTDHNINNINNNNNNTNNNNFNNNNHSNDIYNNNNTNNNNSNVNSLNNIGSNNHDRRNGSLHVPNVSDYRNLFKKSVILEYEADSPLFRTKVDIMEKTVEDLRIHLQLLVDRCRQYCQNGNTFVESGKSFAFLMSTLREPEWANRLGVGLSEFLSSFGNTFEMIESYREAVLLSLETTFSAPMEEFVKLEAKAVRKLKNNVTQLSESYEINLAKFLSLKSSVDDEIFQKKEAELTALNKELELSRYDLISELNILETKKKFQLCERTCAALYTYLSFFTQCHHMVSMMEPAMIKLNSEMSLARNDFRRETILRDAKRIQLKNELDKVKVRGKNKSRIAVAASKTQNKMRNSLNLFTRELGTTHSNIGINSPRLSTNLSTRLQEISEVDDDRENELVKAGYLWKQGTNMMKDWKRRWFFIQNGKLYYSRTDNLANSPPVLVCDLLISTVRENVMSDMRFTFDVISPGQRVYTLQGESEANTKEWIAVIRDQIEKQLALQGTQVDHTEEEGDTTLKITDIDHLYKINQYCADCGASFPSWASLNLCIMICIECSGIHRSLGTHISKVRSISLDRWTNNNLELLTTIGNINANKIWEELILSSPQFENSKILPNATREIREKFIIAKYVDRKFVPSNMSTNDANQLLYQGSLSGKLLDITQAIAYGADVNWKNENDDFKSALHVACSQGHVLAVELLCQWNADVSLLDSLGKTPLDYASDEGGTIIESLVRKLERDLDYQTSFVGDTLLKMAEEEEYMK